MTGLPLPTRLSKAGVTSDRETYSGVGIYKHENAPNVEDQVLLTSVRWPLGIESRPQVEQSDRNIDHFGAGSDCFSDMH